MCSVHHITFFSLELQLETKARVEKEIEKKKEEFEEELLSIERKMSHDPDHDRSRTGDIRDRLDMSKVNTEVLNYQHVENFVIVQNGKLDDSLGSNGLDDDDEDRGFMTNRRIVETDGDRVNGGDLRMTLKNNQVKERSEERQVIVKNEKEVEERKRQRDEEKHKEEERKTRKEEETRSNEKVSEKRREKTKEKAEEKKESSKSSKSKPRDSSSSDSSDSSEDEKSKK